MGSWFEFAQFIQKFYYNQGEFLFWEKNMMVTGNWENATDTSNDTCSCDSWMQHWINATNGHFWPSLCSVLYCNEEPDVGAHVINPDIDGERIIPMCYSCNQKSGSFTIKDNTEYPRADDCY